MRIGELAQRSGLSQDTIRYYEKLSLLVAANRHPESGYRNYDGAALERLQQIQRFKEVGFTLLEIKDLFDAQRQSAICKNWPVQLTQKIEKIDLQLRQLQAQKAILTDVLGACDAHCATDNGLPVCMPAAQLSTRKQGGC